MTIDEFIQRTNAQPVISAQQEVIVFGDELKALLARNTLTLAEIDAHPDQRREMRTFRYGHILNPGICPDELREWQAEHPDHPLPHDLIELLKRVNGIHLWGDIDEGKAYLGISQLREWQDVNDTYWGDWFKSRKLGTLVMSYHSDANAYLALDTRTGTYTFFDLHDFRNPPFVAYTVEELLDSWWAETDWMDPRSSDYMTVVPTDPPPPAR